MYNFTAGKLAKNNELVKASRATQPLSGLCTLLGVTVLLGRGLEHSIRDESREGGKLVFAWYPSVRKFGQKIAPFGEQAR